VDLTISERAAIMEAIESKIPERRGGPRPAIDTSKLAGRPVCSMQDSNERDRTRSVAAQRGKRSKIFWPIGQNILTQTSARALRADRPEVDLADRPDQGIRSADLPKSSGPIGPLDPV
jgi:hypothetical protein